MAIPPLAYYESLKRYWRRRKYQRINGARRKKQQILRLGEATASPPGRRRKLKLHLKIVSPLKLLKKFHEIYVGMMIPLAKKMANRDCNGGKEVAESRHVSLVSSGEEVDRKVVMGMYKKFSASRKYLRTEL